MLYQRPLPRGVSAKTVMLVICLGVPVYRAPSCFL